MSDGATIEFEMLWRRASDADDAGDFALARQIYERGAVLGDPDCWHALGYMFDVGRGGPPDKERAMRCYKTAWRSHRTAAANNIAILYRERGDRRAMFRWFGRAARHGDDGAYLDLAKCYRDGHGVRRSPADAVRCLSRAVNGPCISEDEREEAKELLATLAPRLVES